MLVVHAHSGNKHNSFADTRVKIDEAVQELNQVQRLEDGDRLFEAVELVAGVCKDVLEDDRRLVANLDRMVKIQLDVLSQSSRNAVAGALDGVRSSIKGMSIILL